MSRDSITAAGLALLAFAIYGSNLRLITAGDTYPARYLPFAILRDHTLALDPLLPEVTQGNPRPYWMRTAHGRTLSTYPVTVPVLLTPLYLPAYALLCWRGWTPARLERVARLMEKVSAAAVASTSVALMFLLLTRRTSRGWALALTLAYAFGTDTWMISGQALWQHGVSELALVASLLLITAPAGAGRSLAAGLCCGLAVAARPPDVIFAAALALHVCRRPDVRRGPAAAGAALVALALLAYNLGVVGNIAGGYGSRTGFAANFDRFKYSLAGGVAGLLFSPARGLFVYSPWLALLLVARLRRRGLTELDALLLGAVALQVLFFARLDWRGGCSWGPRWLTDAVPLLVWVLAPAAPAPGRAAFGLAVAFSIGVQIVGAWWYTGGHDMDLIGQSGDPAQMAAAWDPRQSQLAWEVSHPPAPRDLLVEVDGAIDTVTPADAAIAGESITAAGWCLADRRTPHRVRVSLAPRAGTAWRRSPAAGFAEAGEFADRPDVRLARGSSGPCGWRATLSTRDLVPGDYWLCLAAFAAPGGELRQVCQRPFTLLDPDSRLEASPDPARVAARRLRAHQDAAGAWHTAYTADAVFEGVSRERNTFLTALLVDELAPVSAGLEDVLARARAHLAAQVETDGLVRYHGRPDLLDPALGCLISPDADDTALAWRVAALPPGPRLASARATLDAYLTGGLYRTWLAPRERYAGIDPGRDPNPPDIGIQMHVLMFLDRFDPPAARALHEALRTPSDDLWVYYARAPLVPVLRAAELSRLGYPLALPHRDAWVEGQRIWVRACELIADHIMNRSVDRSEVRGLLDELAADGFARVRDEPPLIYHNDLSARARRYYWSEDFGYALWLRLHACGGGS